MAVVGDLGQELSSLLLILWVHWVMRLVGQCKSPSSEGIAVACYRSLRPLLDYAQGGSEDGMDGFGRPDGLDIGGIRWQLARGHTSVSMTGTGIGATRYRAPRTTLLESVTRL